MGALGVACTAELEELLEEEEEDLFAINMNSERSPCLRGLAGC